MNKIKDMDKVISPKYRLRIKFSRTGEAVNITHLEQMREIRKGVVLSEIPVFKANNKKAFPKISFGPAISMGYESLCEFADIYLTELAKENNIKAIFDKMEISGINFVSAKRIPLLFPSLESSVNAVEYEVRGEFLEDFSQDKIKRALLKRELIFEKIKDGKTAKKINFRPLIIKMEHHKEAGLVILVLRIKPGFNIKPEEAVKFIAGSSAKITGILKKQLYWINSGGEFEVF
ncbi:MAG: TIGR03936 family radical SAM-associated protein [Elusimicrobiales bacterium]|nr:TIGR03936 family radical SAM-associated protein [Elusimicrobiales bacterium]